MQHFAALAPVFARGCDAFDVANRIDPTAREHFGTFAFGDLADALGRNLEINPAIEIRAEETCALLVRRLPFLAHRLPIRTGSYRS